MTPSTLRLLRDAATEQRSIRLRIANLVTTARDEGRSWGEISGALGIARQSAWRAHSEKGKSSR